MPHPLRMYDSSECWFITTRCYQARKLMTPRNPLIRAVCGGVLAQAARRYGVKIYAYAFMSNHFHLVVGARGLVIADFIKYLLSNLARKLGPLVEGKWWGKFWERRASVAAILDDAALEDRVKYVLAHGVKERLVRHAWEWEGLHCVDQMADGLPRRFPWFNWTRRWLAKHRKGFETGEAAGRYATEWAEEVELRLEPLPAQRSWTRSQRCRWVYDVLEVEESRHKGKSVLGMDAVKREPPSRPRWRKLGKRPLCHAGSTALWLAWHRDYWLYLNRFRFAAHDWLRGFVGAEFPDVCFKPMVRNEVQVV